MAEKKPVPDLGCATATPLELKLLSAAKAYAAGDVAEKQTARADYVAVLSDYLRQSGQMTDPAILAPLIDPIGETPDDG
jgi:hypothetical protein